MMPSNNDTIVAIATAPGEAAIAIVRLSGPEAFAIADRVTECGSIKPSQRSHRSFFLARIIGDSETDSNPNGFIDQAIMLLFRAPRSFTCQDVIEFQCHGGSLAARRIYRLLLAQGARPALPGEFTRRAFLNGRIDLVKAEAVADLIRARTLRAAEVATEQLNGSLSLMFESIYENILSVLAELEARLDFPEETMLDLEEQLWRPAMQQAITMIERLMETWEQGRLVRDGALVVIAGATNVGKSTLLNALAEQDRAIVSPNPGTTRDSIEIEMQLNGIPICLTDTAGYRQTDCRIEQDGIERTDRLRRAADVLIYVIDAYTPDQAFDWQNLSEADPARTLLVFNKIDLGQTIDSGLYDFDKKVFTSLTTSDRGIPEIKQALVELLHSGSTANVSPVLISERHRELLRSALTALHEAESLLIATEDCQVLAAVCLRDGLGVLDECLGRKFDNALLDRVFSKFCIGK